MTFVALAFRYTCIYGAWMQACAGPSVQLDPTTSPPAVSDAMIHRLTVVRSLLLSYELSPSPNVCGLLSIMLNYPFLQTISQLVQDMVSFTSLFYSFYLDENRVSSCIAERRSAVGN